VGVQPCLVQKCAAAFLPAAFFCPDLRGFGAVCAFAATLIPKFGGLNMNLF